MREVDLAARRSTREIEAVEGVRLIAPALGERLIAAGRSEIAELDLRSGSILSHPARKLS